VDAARLLTVLRPHFEATRARWMLVGGFAVAAWGSARTTLDLDILVDDAARTQLLARIVGEGFEASNDTDGFTNLEHPDPALGRLDFLWVDGLTRDRLFAEAVSRTGPDGLAVLVPSPEHLVAMKVKAIKNKPIRVLRDSEDLRVLLNRPEIDQDQARETFERNGLLELYDRLKALL
jgi:hypothetical protein